MRLVTLVIGGIFICASISDGVENKPMQTQDSTGKTERQEPAPLIADALRIIKGHLVINENLTIKDAGDKGAIMDAYRKLKEAQAGQPADLYLQYATICALRVAAQFDSASKEMATFSQEHPEFPLAKFTLEAWQAKADEIAPAPFRYPECTPTMKELHPLYARLVKTCVLSPARDGIYPRAILFLKDNEAYWTKDMLKNARVEIAVIHEAQNPQLAALYARTLLPGKKPDMQEALTVLTAPKADSSVAPWLYLWEVGRVTS